MASTPEVAVAMVFIVIPAQAGILEWPRRLSQQRESLAICPAISRVALDSRLRGNDGRIEPDIRRPDAVSAPQSMLRCTNIARENGTLPDMVLCIGADLLLSLRAPYKCG